MAYRLKTDEPVAKSVRRIALDEIEAAVGQLKNSKDRDKAIHEARKSLKKLRGLLRLVQPELGTVYQAENTRLRNLGRKLSELRDAKATVEIFDSLMAGGEDQSQKSAGGLAVSRHSQRPKPLADIPGRRSPPRLHATDRPQSRSVLSARPLCASSPKRVSPPFDVDLK